MRYQTPRGTKDIFGEAVLQWRALEQQIHALCRDFNFREIRTPVFEHTELFTRSSGEASDVVQKEMYTFEDKGGRSVSLKPEGTAGAARAFIEHGMFSGAQPTKLYYIGPAFRYDKPGAGRWRQHHQFGVEHYGSFSPAADAEVISIAYELFRRLGIKGFTVFINSLGGRECYKAYNKILMEFVTGNMGRLCETCRTRAGVNPMRILDCKETRCRGVLADAPSPADSLGSECAAHFNELKNHLTDMSVPYETDGKLVRGLDYYTRTVFEFIDGESGLTICGGGRYDTLIEECGGPAMGGVGYGIGLERIIMMLEKNGESEALPDSADIYLGWAGSRGFSKAMSLAYELRKSGVSAEFDSVGRSVKAQMKYADRLGARYSAIIGDDEIESGKLVLKDMRGGPQAECELDQSSIVNFLPR